MRPRHILLLLGALLLAAGLLWLALRPTPVVLLDTSSVAHAPRPVPEVAPAPSAAPAANAPVDAEDPPADEEAEPDPQPEPLALPRLESFMASSIEGDDRAPPIGTSTPREPPPAEALERPDLYQQYERAQEEKLHRAFISAAHEQEKVISDAITRARAAGMTDAEIAEGEEKLERLRAMREELQQRYPDTRQNTPPAPVDSP